MFSMSQAYVKATSSKCPVLASPIGLQLSSSRCLHFRLPRHPMLQLLSTATAPSHHFSNQIQSSSKSLAFKDRQLQLRLPRLDGDLLDLNHLDTTPAALPHRKLNFDFLQRYSSRPIGLGPLCRCLARVDLPVAMTVSGGGSAGIMSTREGVRIVRIEED